MVLSSAQARAMARWSSELRVRSWASSQAWRWVRVVAAMSSPSGVVRKSTLRRSFGSGVRIA